jgi:glycosyltransferase involved in cell wall biosynthesis
MAHPYLSVIVPAYNEETNYSRGVLDNIFAYLSKQPYTWEIILSDDGSTDTTPELLQKFADTHLGARVVRNHHRGKAATVASGMLAATGEYRLFTDFDQSTPLFEVEKFWPFIEDNYDVVIGSREVQGARRDKEPLHRHLMGKGFNLVVQTLAVPGIFDTQCGFKLFSAKATELLFPRLIVYAAKERADAYTGAFDVELLVLARKFGFRIAEVPVAWAHNLTNRVSPVKDSLRMFADIVRIRVALWQKRYDQLPSTQS